MGQIHPLVAEYLATILGFNAPAFAKMNEPGSERKYTKIYQRLSDILRHLAERRGCRKRLVYERNPWIQPAMRNRIVS